jgi:chromosome partitioning protein
VRIAVVNAKGGVGKTTTSMYVAAGLARHGRTLVVDTDPDASAQSWAGQAGEALRFTVVGLTHGIRQGVQRLEREGGYAHWVGDSPPGHGDRGLSRALLDEADDAIVPLSPRFLDADRLRSTEQLVADVAETNPKLRVWLLLNQVRRGTTMSRLVREHLEGEGYSLLPSVPLLEAYATAFGGPIEDLGDWGPVVGALLDGAA